MEDETLVAESNIHSHVSCPLHADARLIFSHCLKADYCVLYRTFFAVEGGRAIAMLEMCGFDGLW
jgi:hypothetical protein